MALVEIPQAREQLAHDEDHRGVRKRPGLDQHREIDPINVLHHQEGPPRRIALEVDDRDQVRVPELGSAKLLRRGPWVVSKLDGELLGYWTMLEAVRKLYERAGVEIPVSETGETMPWHSLRHYPDRRIIPRRVGATVAVVGGKPPAHSSDAG